MLITAAAIRWIVVYLTRTSSDFNSTTTVKVNSVCYGFSIAALRRIMYGVDTWW